MPFFRRPHRRPFPRGPMRPRGGRPGQRRLRRAHALLARGEAAAAAKIFEQLARSAEERGFPHAPRLALQAGLAWVQGGELKRGMAILQESLQSMAGDGHVRKLQASTARVAAELRNMGHASEADELLATMRLAHPDIDFELRMPAPHASRPNLPSQCPKCGGPVHPDELEWPSAGMPPCEYCGIGLGSKK